MLGSLYRNALVPSSAVLPPGLWGKHQEAFHSYWLETLGWHENPSQWPRAVQIQVRVPVRVLREPQTVKLQSRLLKGQHHWTDRFLAAFFMKTAQEIMCAQIEHLEKLVLFILILFIFILRPHIIHPKLTWNHDFELLLFLLLTHQC